MNDAAMIYRLYVVRPRKVAAVYFAIATAMLTFGFARLYSGTVVECVFLLSAGLSCFMCGCSSLVEAQEGVRELRTLNLHISKSVQ